MVEHVLFDAANTLIHKPAIWSTWQKVLKSHGAVIAELELRRVHKLTSETVRFPDRTDGAFYKSFNASVLYNLGIIPTESLLNDLFLSMHKLEWEVFDDCMVVSTIQLPVSVASNFDTSLNSKLEKHFGFRFYKVVVSEEIGHRKPSESFYQKAVEALGVESSKVLYIGDSLELDIHPAQKIGMKAYLIDREGFYLNFENRIESMSEINSLIEKIR
ncbi:MAG: HAD family hydrolase [Flavobacteriales bacterium]|nr:HAD family hydrolase [Flavobacteriales bacterium]